MFFLFIRIIYIHKKIYLFWFDFFTFFFLIHLIITAQFRYHANKKLGCAATNLSQNMFFTGTTIPLTDVMHQNHQSVAMTQNRTPPTLFQYPSKWNFFLQIYHTSWILKGKTVSILLKCHLIQFLKERKSQFEVYETHLQRNKN